jgi:hypothetical protein
VSAFVDGEAKNGRLIAAGLNNDKRQRLLHLNSRTDGDAANEFPRFGWNHETLHYERP